MQHNSLLVPVVTGDHADLTAALDSVTATHPKITLNQLVTLCIEKEASDIHFREGGRAALRVDGKIVLIENADILSSEEVHGMIKEMLLSEDEQRRLERVREIDCSYVHESGVSFRVNVFYQRGHLAAVMRMISKHLPALDALAVPAVVKDLLTLRQGLILVTGMAGSGKSTTIQAMLEYVNQNFTEHIITIENPIEHLFDDQKSIFTQREIGKDTLTFLNALQAAVHEDPNIIMLSEISDAEMLDRVLTVVETGHLVIASMLTKSAEQTLERMLLMAPQDQHDIFQRRVSDSLLAILSQGLADCADHAGRVAVYGLMLNTPDVRNTIRHGSFNQIPTLVQSGSEEGMISMQEHAVQLFEKGLITQESVAQFSEENL